MSVLAEIVSEQWEFRELLVRMTARDLLLRYKQTVMGFGWAVFMPLVNTAIFSVIFTRVAVIDVGGPYPVYAFCGLVAWNFFSSALRFSVTSLTSNPSLVTKVYFPREIFPFSAVLVALVDFAVSRTGPRRGDALLPGQHRLADPAAAGGHGRTADLHRGGGAASSRWANLFYRDVKYLFEIVIAFWMFATSVVYPIGRVGGRLGALLALNPMTHLIDAFRAVLLDRPRARCPLLRDLRRLAGAVRSAPGSLFHLAEFDFAENL